MCNLGVKGPGQLRLLGAFPLSPMCHLSLKSTYLTDPHRQHVSVCHVSEVTGKAKVCLVSLESLQTRVSEDSRCGRASSRGLHLSQC